MQNFQQFNVNKEILIPYPKIYLLGINVLVDCLLLLLWILYYFPNIANTKNLEHSLIKMHLDFTEEKHLKLSGPLNWLIILPIIIIIIIIIVAVVIIIINKEVLPCC